jgi:hypothetical protein
MKKHFWIVIPTKGGISQAADGCCSQHTQEKVVCDAVDGMPLLVVMIIGMINTQRDSN